MRGERTHQKDGSDLIGVCKECHDFLHANDTHNTRALVTTIIEQMIKRACEAIMNESDVPEFLRERTMEARYLARTMNVLYTQKKV